MKRYGVLRALLWLAAAALMLASSWRGDARLGSAAGLLALLAIGIFAPPALRGALAVVAGCAGLALLLGGCALLVEVLPALITAFVGWMFARTLLPGRRPLIARAVAAIDGEDWLALPAVARYARRLTILWVLVQAALTALALVIALQAHGAWPGVRLPAPHAFAGLVLPGVVAGVFVLEFALRRAFLPDAPRHTLPAFVTRLARAWPRLVE